MKNLVKILLLTATVVFAAACHEGRSSATLLVCASFEADDNYVKTYFSDSLLYAPKFYWEQIAYVTSTSTEMNSGYGGGFKLSRKKGSPADSDDMAYFTSAGSSAGLSSDGYAGYYQSSLMPKYDIVYELDGYYSAVNVVVGCCIDNSEYNLRIKEEGLLKEGDYLKVIAKFYYKDNLVGSVEKYLVDNSGSSPVFIEDWVTWEMSDDVKTPMDAVKFEVETSGLAPCFCLDNFVTKLAIEY